MAKKVGISLRKPPPAADVDAFVHGDEQTPVSQTEVRPLARREEVTIALPGGREYREVTVILPQDLARRLAVHCMEKDRDTSNVLAEVVRDHLDLLEHPAEPVAEPVVPEPPRPRWQVVAHNVASLLRARMRRA